MWSRKAQHQFQKNTSNRDGQRQWMEAFRAVLPVLHLFQKQLQKVVQRFQMPAKELEIKAAIINDISLKCMFFWHATKSTSSNSHAVKDCQRGKALLESLVR